MSIHISGEYIPRRKTAESHDMHMFSFRRQLPTGFPKLLNQFIFLVVVYVSSSYSISSPILVTVSFFPPTLDILVYRYLIVDLNLDSDK